jgi:hypothetical protein
MKNIRHVHVTRELVECFDLHRDSLRSRPVTLIKLQADHIQNACPDRLDLACSNFELYWSVLKSRMLFDDDAHYLIVINDLIGQIGEADQALRHADITSQ